MIAMIAILFNLGITLSRLWRGLVDCVDCVQSRELGVRDSSSEVYQWLLILNYIPINRAFYIDHCSVYITVFLFGRKRGKKS